MTRETTIAVDIACILDKEYFGDWNELTPEVRKAWDSHPVRVPCGGSGEMTGYCVNCKFCEKFEVDEL